MKIAYCLPDQQWIDAVRSGALRDAAHIQQSYVAAGLRGRGHALTFVAPRDLHQTVYARTDEELALAPRTWSNRGWFELSARLAWRLQQLLGIPYLNVFSNLRRYDAALQILPGHDLVFERNSLYNVGVAQACRKLGLPYVMFFDADQIAELDYVGQPLVGWLRRRAEDLLRENLAVARRVICVSEPAGEHLSAHWQVPSGKIVVLPNAVDIHRFQPDPERRAAARAALQLTDQPLLVFVGSFYKWHDIPTLLEAFAQLRMACPEARLVLVGDGAEREAMEQRVRLLGIAPAVHFTGYVTHAEVSQFVNAADIAIVPVPSMQQDLWLSPMKLFEYMAAGKAIVASALGQIRHVIRDGDNGLLVPAGKAGALAAALQRLIADPDLRTRLGRQARADAVRDHSWEQYLTELENLFSAIAGPAGQRPDA